jgi:molecular chaperone HscB
MTFFDFYNFEESFFIDKKLLRKVYLEKSRALHPDLAVKESFENSETELDLASFNNEAFTVLSDEMQTIKYILLLNDVPIDAKNAPMPNDFLLEMMDLNENIMEAKFEKNETVLNDLVNSINDISSSLTNSYFDILKEYNKALPIDERNNLLLKARAYYLKMNYIKRLKENLEGKSEI